MPLRRVIEAQLCAAIWECCDPRFARAVVDSVAFQGVLQAVEEDALAYARKDPSSKGDPVSVVQGTTSLRAVLHYRLAHGLLQIEPDGAGAAEGEAYATLIASRGKLLSGADLHPRCHIGQRFVLDHGVGTVIGETAVLGDDCYVLGGVTLGACGIAGNAPVKRHPSIGCRVQIGAFARIFGDIQIGDDVFIGPNCVISRSVPAGCRVTVRSSLQITRRAVGSSTEPA